MGGHASGFGREPCTSGEGTEIDSELHAGKNREEERIQSDRERDERYALARGIRLAGEGLRRRRLRFRAQQRSVQEDFPLHYL